MASNGGPATYYVRQNNHRINGETGIEVKHKKLLNKTWNHRHTDTRTHRHTDTRTHGHIDTKTHIDTHQLYPVNFCHLIKRYEQNCGAPEVV